ncbi:Reticulon-like protein B12 [Linum perenne]
MVNQAATLIRTNVNDLLAASQNIALGKDTKLFVKVAACLLLMAIVGGLTDLLTLGYTSLLIILTVPVLYERYGDDVDRFVKRTGYKIQKLYYKFDADVICRAKNICVQKQKLS